MTKWLFLLRALFPSWRFFDEVSTELTLDVRVGDRSDNFGPWICALKPISRSVRRLFLNSEGGFLLASHSLLSLLSSDVLAQSEEVSEASIEERTSYRLVQNIARTAAESMRSTNRSLFYQFRLCANSNEAILVSAIYETTK